MTCRWILTRRCVHGCATTLKITPVGDIVGLIMCPRLWRDEGLWVLQRYQRKRMGFSRIDANDGATRNRAQPQRLTLQKNPVLTNYVSCTSYMGHLQRTL